jgi:hypothetical protein
MPEPLTLAAVAVSIVTEGIKFLYGQAADAIKRWRDEKGRPTKSDTVVVQTSPPAIFDGALGPLLIHGNQVETLEDHLIKLRRALADYADGLEPVDMGNAALLETVDTLRQAMEAVYQQRLTFRGEQRSASGPVVEGAIDAKSIAGIAAGVEARWIANGKVIGTIKTEKVEPGGSAYGVKVDRIGGSGST